MTIVIFYSKIIYTTYNANNNLYELNLLATTLGNTESVLFRSSEVSNNCIPFKLRHSSDSACLGNFASNDSSARQSKIDQPSTLVRSISIESLRAKRTLSMRGRSNSNVSMLSLRYINEIALENHAPFNASCRVLKSSILLCASFSLVWISDAIHLFLDSKHNHDKKSSNPEVITICQIHATVFLMMFICNSYCYKV